MEKLFAVIPTARIAIVGFVFRRYFVVVSFLNLFHPRSPMIALNQAKKDWDTSAEGAG
jgi:hypothetical protein